MFKWSHHSNVRLVGRPDRTAIIHRVSHQWPFAVSVYVLLPVCCPGEMKEGGGGGGLPMIALCGSF